MYHEHCGDRYIDNISLVTQNVVRNANAVVTAFVDFSYIKTNVFDKQDNRHHNTNKLSVLFQDSSAS